MSVPPGAATGSDIPKSSTDSDSPLFTSARPVGSDDDKDNLWKTAQSPKKKDELSNQCSPKRKKDSSVARGSSVFSGGGGGLFGGASGSGSGGGGLLDIHVIDPDGDDWGADVDHAHERGEHDKDLHLGGDLSNPFIFPAKDGQGAAMKAVKPAASTDDIPSLVHNTKSATGLAALNSPLSRRSPERNIKSAKQNSNLIGDSGIVSWVHDGGRHSNIFSSAGFFNFRRGDADNYERAISNADLFSVGRGGTTTAGLDSDDWTVLPSMCAIAPLDTAWPCYHLPFVAEPAESKKSRLQMRELDRANELYQQYLTRKANEEEEEADDDAKDDSMVNTANK